MQGPNFTKLQELAYESGFEFFGITHPRSWKEGEEKIQAWTAEGRHGAMRYLEEIAKRREAFVEGKKPIRSIFVLGVSYYQGPYPERPSSQKIYGRVARYAWGRDYHLWIAERHQDFIEKLRLHFGKDIAAYSCVDVHPLPERYLGMKAGLGFVGKHTNLLNAQYGPWFFLSEVLTDLELQESLPSQGNCGPCVLCQKICPTGALDRDYSMDANRCIAYLTIEHKGVIPRQLRPLVGDWIFGCDACLEVCPFGRKAPLSPVSEFFKDYGVGPWLEISTLFQIHSNRQFRAHFQGTPFLRVTRKQLMRNACLVLANSGSEQAVEWLKQALCDPAWLVRLHAAWGLGRLMGKTAHLILTKHLAYETHPQVVEEIRAVLDGMSLSVG